MVIAPVFQAEQGQPLSENVSYAKYAETSGNGARLGTIGSYFHAGKESGDVYEGSLAVDDGLSNHYPVYRTPPNPAGSVFIRGIDSASLRGLRVVVPGIEALAADQRSRIYQAVYGASAQAGQYPGPIDQPLRWKRRD